MLYIKWIDKNAYWLLSWFDFHSISCSIILFWIKKYSHGKIFLFGLWQMVLILKISYSGKIAPVAGAILPSYIFF